MNRDRLIKIDEAEILCSPVQGTQARDALKSICNLIDIVFKEMSNCEIDYDFFDIKGSVLLHGGPGVGKTTIMRCCMNYALENYGADCYQIETANIIEADLGKSVENFRNALDEFYSKDSAILFLDEVDRLCVNRQNNIEISELKRMLLEFMGFLDRLRISDKKMVLCCTNVLNQLDQALLRRFSICQEIGTPSEEDIISYCNICGKKSGLCGSVVKVLDVQKIKTFDDVKGVFRKYIIEGNHSLEKLSKVFDIKEV